MSDAGFATAEAVARRVVDGAQRSTPKTWSGTVTGYNAATRTAQVHLDGDPASVSVSATNLLVATPVVSGRVVVLLQPPSGALLIGVLDTSVTVLTSAVLASYALDAAVVHLAGTETIAGAKTFSAAVTLAGATSTADITAPNTDLAYAAYLMTPGVL